ncbi:putative periplasmic acid stress chaperone [Escherichia coli]|uniref:Putative periplasmic acid stress chaperone n=4 Tax=Pseudomonadota TaxID=1224 RepID=A0A376TY02_ECOLX|nr:putative periplasmic acid stress chaperone [Escherichia coli]
MKKVLGVILGGLLLLPVVSNAADAQKAADNKKPVNSWTCEDFLAVDESFQPTAVGFAEALNNKDKPEDAVLDVQGIATVTQLSFRLVLRINKPTLKIKLKANGTKLRKICNSGNALHRTSLHIEQAEYLL